MTTDTSQLLLFAALGITLVGAVTDTRTGKLPNLLTLPPLLLAPLVHGLVSGPGALALSVAGALGCALVPLFLFTRGAIGGGDVKLFAALGALLGFTSGLEVQMLSFALAALYALGQLAWEGKLFAMFGNVARLMLNPLLPERYRRPIEPQLMTTVRLGGLIFLSCLLGAVPGVLV